MLRIHFMQWFGYSDSAMGEALHDVPLMRGFAGPDAFEDVMPDESTILRFRHLLEKHRAGPWNSDSRISDLSEFSPQPLQTPRIGRTVSSYAQSASLPLAVYRISVSASRSKSADKRDKNLYP